MAARREEAEEISGGEAERLLPAAPAARRSGNEGVAGLSAAFLFSGATVSGGVAGLSATLLFSGATVSEGVAGLSETLLWRNGKRRSR